MTDGPAELNAAGLKALAQGQPESAVTLLRRAVAADTASPLLWYNLATALRNAGQDAEHDSAIDEALSRDPYFAHALLAKGQFREAAGDAPTEPTPDET